MFFALCLNSLWLLNLDTEALEFFLFFLEALLRCRFVVVAMLKSCRDPSSTFLYSGFFVGHGFFQPVSLTSVHILYSM